MTRLSEEDRESLLRSLNTGVDRPVNKQTGDDFVDWLTEEANFSEIFPSSPPPVGKIQALDMILEALAAGRPWVAQSYFCVAAYKHYLRAREAEPTQTKSSLSSFIPTV